MTIFYVKKCVSIKSTFFNLAYNIFNLLAKNTHFCSIRKYIMFNKRNSFHGSYLGDKQRVAIMHKHGITSYSNLTKIICNSLWEMVFSISSEKVKTPKYVFLMLNCLGAIAISKKIYSYPNHIAISYSQIWIYYPPGAFNSKNTDMTVFTFFR